MKWLHRNTAPLLLMAGSLLLLAAFLGVWLTKVYRDELARLKEQTDFLFLSSVREIEDSLFTELLVRPIGESLEDSCAENANQVVLQRRFDSTQVMLFQQRTQTPDSLVQISIRSTMDTVENGKSIKGAIAFFVDAAGQGHSLDSILFRIDSLDIAQMLAGQVASTFSGSDFPRGVRLIRLTGGDTVQTKVIRSVSYADIVKGDRYAAQVERYTPYLFRKMASEAAFALLLFASVCTAFFVVYKNLLKQQRLTDLKNDFIRNMTHELKTPITTVGVAIEALGEFHALQDPEKTREYLEISRHELNRLSLLADKVLKMSQFEDSRPALNITTFDLKKLIGEVLDSLRISVENKGAKVDFQFTGDSFLMEGDASHLASVVYNLIDNALKYSPGNPVVHIDMDALDGRYRLSVSDQGIGIPSEYLKRIFDPFFRVPAGDRHDVKGHGLGLSYVAAVVRRHHGEITAESRLGEGSRFIITLPASYEPH